MKALLLNTLLVLNVGLTFVGAFATITFISNLCFGGSSVSPTVRAFLSAVFGVMAFVLPFHPYFSLGIKSIMRHDGTVRREIVYGGANNQTDEALMNSPPDAPERNDHSAPSRQ